MRPFDIVLLGATGYTGRLVAECLARAPETEGLVCALAGRDRDKLARTRDRAWGRAELLHADTSDPATLVALAQKTRVLCSTVGPYAKHGSDVVAACAHHGTDYCDITGETFWMRRMIELHHDTAQRTGARIVHACGFDSIPADVGARFTAEELPPGEPLEIAAYVESSGEHPDWRGSWHSISGGTWHSAIGFLTPSELSRARASLARIAAGAPAGRSVGPLPERLRRAPDEVGGWAVPMPTIDREVVLRSAAGDDRYGPRFRYGHHLRVGSLAGVAAAGVGVATLFGLAQLPPTRRFLLSLKQPGEGPSPEERARNRFCVSFVGTTPGARVVAQVRGGDPGYGDTAKMVGEAALCLAEDRAQLPDRAGVLTPVLAMGDALLPRLRAAGIAVETVARS
jgi:short subunit dehydrogenase-like uncharacterized protein